MTQFTVALGRKEAGTLADAFDAAGLKELLPENAGRRVVLDLTATQADRLKTRPALRVEPLIGHGFG